MSDTANKIFLPKPQIARNALAKSVHEPIGIFLKRSAPKLLHAAKSIAQNEVSLKARLLIQKGASAGKPIPHSLRSQNRHQFEQSGPNGFAGQSHTRRMHNRAQLFHAMRSCKAFD